MGMSRITSATRMALSIGIGCASLIWIATSTGLIPNPITQQAKSRILTTKVIAVSVSSFAESPRQTGLRKVLERFVAANKNLSSVGILRRGQRDYFITVGPHSKNWTVQHENDPEKQIGVEILANGNQWGHLQLAFNPYQEVGKEGLVFPFGLILFLFAATSLLSWAVLSKSLKYLNPSKVVPNRVRSALDSLAEGLVLVDNSGEIAHANSAFLKMTSSTSNEILGRKLDNFDWKQLDERGGLELPWHECLAREVQITGEVIQLKVKNAPTRKFATNATPILSGNDTVRGALVSFDDVTMIENKNAELAKMIGSLRTSRDEVAKQNERLNFLASYDPLTKCMNRRAFFGEFEKYWNDEDCTDLSLMILDIDNFKSVNDNHGHSVGDEVLRATGSLLREAIGDKGQVCRYGGEEFVLLIPNLDISECEALANYVRKAIQRTEASGINFTASFGISCRDFKPMDPQHMLDQADESLYVAKRSGRNRVVRYDRLEEASVEEEKNALDLDSETEIPYSAVTGLLSALSFRCSETAEHSIRVADLCVVVGQKLMSRRGLYRLEVAALLHDIGKIGVPDAILKKPGSLNAEEWGIMRKHDSIGGEIVRNALASETIANYIESHHLSFSLKNLAVARPGGLSEIPLAARIITVCDAFDAMTHDRVYRKAIPVEEALVELSKNSKNQFDPEVVEILATYIRSGCHNPTLGSAAPIFSSRQATAIGQHIEHLCLAIGEEDVDKLQLVINQLREDSVNDTRVAKVAEQLDLVIDSSCDDLDKVMNLANEMMQMCRESRSSIVNAAESIVSSP